MLDIERILRKKGLTQQQIDLLKAEVRREFPNDDMMYELHLIRLVHSLMEGYCNLKDLLPLEEQKRSVNS